MCSESDNWLTAHFHAHIGHWAHCPITWIHQAVESLHVYMHTVSACKRAVTRVSDVCMYMWRESDNWLTAHFHAHISPWAHRPITWTHKTVGSLHVYKHTSGASKHAVTRVSDVCMWMCRESDKWLDQYTYSCTHRPLGSLPNYMNTSDSQITAHLYAHIKCM